MTPATLISEVLKVDLPHKSRLILSYAIGDHTNPTFKAKLNQSELARTIGCSRATINRHLQTLKPIMKPVRASGRSRAITYQVDLRSLISAIPIAIQGEAPAPPGWENPDDLEGGFSHAAQVDSTVQISSSFAQRSESFTQKNVGELIQEVMSERHANYTERSTGFTQKNQAVKIQGLIGAVEVRVAPIVAGARPEELYLNSSLSSPKKERKQEYKYTGTASTIEAPERPEFPTGGPCDLYAETLPCIHTSAACKRLTLALGLDHPFPPSGNLHAFIHARSVDEAVTMAMYLQRDGHQLDYIKCGAFNPKRYPEHLAEAKKTIVVADSKLPTQPAKRASTARHRKPTTPRLGGDAVRPIPKTFVQQEAEKADLNRQRAEAVRRARQEQIDNCPHEMPDPQPDGTWVCQCGATFSAEDAERRDFHGRYER